MHTVDRTYHCAKCNKIFFKEVSLLTHQCTSKAQLGKKTAAKSLQKTSSYDTDKKYKCSKCDASFATSQSRNAHMRMHAEGTHSSTVCSVRFNAQFQLHIQEYIHAYIMHILKPIITLTNNYI